MKRIVWLASYPKSGNTWFRALLTNYVQDPSEPASIDRLLGIPIASDRRLFDELAGVKASDLTPDEVESLRPRVYRSWARTLRETRYCKAHDAATRDVNGAPLFPEAVTRGVLYLVRDPRDVAVSYAAHRERSLEDTVAAMADPSHQMAGSAWTIGSQVRQRLLTWSGHVTSWRASGLPVHVVRYEDLQQDPGEALARALRFLDRDPDPGRVRRAVGFSRFEVLQEQERQGGFRERPPGNRAFFREGRTGAGRRELTLAQVRAIEDVHGEVMQSLGYLERKVPKGGRGPGREGGDP